MPWQSLADYGKDKSKELKYWQDDVQNMPMLSEDLRDGQE